MANNICFVAIFKNFYIAFNYTVMATYCIMVQTFKKLVAYEIAEVQDSEDPPSNPTYSKRTFGYVSGSSEEKSYKKKGLHVATFSLYRCI